ncbi:MAG: cysteine synthase A [Candidatus Margulisiibacteriota bacterium]|nr:cysteine synthase A [Candidatus Margulisiibacteriota bacterium]
MRALKDKIGNTPIIRLNYLSDAYGVNLYGKCEFMNPSGSVKDRAAYAMIHDALDTGIITDKTHIIEPTSGNTGIALAFICASLGLKLTLTMPESMSVERRQLLKAYGANLDLTPAHLGMSGAIARATELAAKNSFIPQQFENESNPNMHYRTTGPEILNDLDVDVFVAGVGTGGTITGVGRYLKERKDVKVIAVEPSDSPVLSGGEAGPHMIQGIGAGFVPKNLDRAIIDEVFTISNNEAIDMATLIAKKEGVFCGISAGGNVHAALEVAKRPENKDKKIVTILCDTGERYLSMNLFNGGNK